MNFTLTRIRKTQSGIFGEMRSDDNVVFLKTLEHAYLDDGKYYAKIPCGVYTCIRRKSPHFGYDLFMLQGVPGHDFVEIHVGNFNDESEGCILLGLGSTLVSITNSQTAFERFMKYQDGVNEFQLTVQDAV